MTVILQSTVCLTVLLAGVAAPLTTILDTDPDPIRFDDGMYSAKRLDRQMVGDMSVGMRPSGGAEASLAVLTLYLLRKAAPAGPQAPAAVLEPRREEGSESTPIKPIDLLPVIGAVSPPTVATSGITLVGQMLGK